MRCILALAAAAVALLSPFTAARPVSVGNGIRPVLRYNTKLHLYNACYKGNQNPFPPKRGSGLGSGLGVRGLLPGFGGGKKMDKVQAKNGKLISGTLRYAHMHV